MPEHITAENILNSIMGTFSDSMPKQKPMTFFEEESSVSSRMNKLFGRQKSLHKIFGGGKSADVLLWRNKKISSSVLIGATAIWILFEWLNYNFLTFFCFSLALGMVIQCAWSRAAGLLNRSSSKAPRLVLPNELFVNMAVTVCAEVNRFLGFLQDVASGQNIKQFIAVVLSLWAAAIVGGLCNFLTVAYIGFLAAHTLPVLYEKHEDKVDNSVYYLLGQLQNQFQKFDSGVLSRIPKGNFKSKKFD